MTTCWRCGIEFEGSGDTCLDCQETEPSTAVHWPVLRDYIDTLRHAQWELIKDMYQAGKFDPEIADALGVSKVTIAGVRKYFGKPPNKSPDMYLWKDQAAHAEHAASMVNYRKTTKRGKSVDNFDGSGPRRP